MIRSGPGTRIWLACGFIDMRRGFDGLAAQVQGQLEQDPFSGQLFIFRRRKSDRAKLLWWDGDGLCLLAKRHIFNLGTWMPGGKPTGRVGEVPL